MKRSLGCLSFLLLSVAGCSDDAQAPSAEVTDSGDDGTTNDTNPGFDSAGADTNAADSGSELDTTTPVEDSAADTYVASDAASDTRDSSTSDTATDTAIPGFGGTITLTVPAVTCASGTWCVESSTIMRGFSDLHGAVSGSSANDVWWAGSAFSSTDNASLVHYADGKWQRVVPPSTVSKQLTAIWAASPTDVWVGEGFGRIAHFNGTSWTSYASQNGSRAVRAIWGSSATDVWFAYEGEVLAHYTSGTWTALTVPGNATESSYYALSGTSASNVWAVGEAGTVQRWNGSSWTKITSGTTTNLVGVYATSATSLVAVPFSSTEYPRMYNGTTWTAPAFPAPPSSFLRAAHGRSASDLFVTDEGGGIHKWNGSAWTSARPTSQRMRGVYAAPGGHVWAIGPRAIAHYAP